MKEANSLKDAIYQNQAKKKEKIWIIQYLKQTLEFKG